MDMIIHTSRIRVGYPNDREQPKLFKVYVGRSTGDYFTVVSIGTSTPNIPGGSRELAIEHIIDGGITGVYYIKVSAIHYDDTEEFGDEFTINVVEPTDEVIAPIVSVY